MTEATIVAPTAPAAAPEALGVAPQTPEATPVPTIGEEPVAPDVEAGHAYEPTGDPGLDLALDFVGNLGFTPSDAAMQAAEKGDFTLIREKLAGLGAKAKGYEKYIALAEHAFKAHKDGVEAKATKDAQTVHDAVGGKEQWEAVSKWAGENADPEERVSVNAALRQGGLVAKAMAEWLGNKYRSAKGTVVSPARVTAPGAAAQPVSSGPLTAAEYAKETQTLSRKLGPKFDTSPEYQALQARRSAARRAGK